MSGADLSANADEHVAGAKIKTFAPFGSNRRGFSTYSCCFFSGFSGWKYVYTFSASHLSSISTLSVTVDSAVQKKSHWPWQKELPPTTLLHTNVPVVALRCEYIGDVFWILLAFIESVKLLKCVKVAEKTWITATQYLCQHHFYDQFNRWKLRFLAKSSINKQHFNILEPHLYYLSRSIILNAT